MITHRQHDLDELSEFLDGRLAGARRLAVEERLRECAECRAAHQSLSWAKKEAGRLREAEAPKALEEDLKRAIRAAAGPPLAPPLAGAKATARRPRFFGLLAAAVLIAGLALLLTRLGLPTLAPLPEAIAADVRAREAGRLQLALETSEAKHLEAFLADRQLGFPTRVLDLGMMGFELRGGQADLVAGRPSALMVYRETGQGVEVLCRMLREGLTTLPPPTDTREHDGIRFQVYRLGEVTIVFWPEGEVLCALAGRGDPEALVRLAFGKAMKAARAH